MRAFIETRFALGWSDVSSERPEPCEALGSIFPFADHPSLRANAKQSRLFKRMNRLDCRVGLAPVSQRRGRLTRLFPQRGVDTLLLDEFGMRAFLDKTAGFHHEDLVHLDHGMQPVGDGDHRAPG